MVVDKPVESFAKLNYSLSDFCFEASRSYAVSSSAGALQLMPHLVESQLSINITKELFMELNNKQRKILEAIFTDPILTNINWQDIENLFIAVGATITQGQGSRVRVLLNDFRAVFHEPHPQKETDRGAVKSVREFLIKAGVEL